MCGEARRTKGHQRGASEARAEWASGGTVEHTRSRPPARVSPRLHAHTISPWLRPPPGSSPHRRRCTTTVDPGATPRAQSVAPAQAGRPENRSCAGRSHQSAPGHRLGIERAWSTRPNDASLPTQTCASASPSRGPTTVTVSPWRHSEGAGTRSKQYSMPCIVGVLSGLSPRVVGVCGVGVLRVVVLRAGNADGTCGADDATGMRIGRDTLAGEGVATL